MAFYHCIIFLALLSTPVWSYGSGAPKTGCSTLGPLHKDANGQPTPSQRGAAPYKFELSGNTATASKSLPIKLSATGSEAIQGFLIQAQLDGKPVGTFSAKSSVNQAQVLTCQTKDDSITHTKIYDAKVKSVNFDWTPSNDLKGKTVKLIGTVAADKDKFWVKGVSIDVKVN